MRRLQGGACSFDSPTMALTIVRPTTNELYLAFTYLETELNSVSDLFNDSLEENRVVAKELADIIEHDEDTYTAPSGLWP